MSAIDTPCYTLSPEKESGAGEMKCYKPSICQVSHVIASEIMNNIMDNVFEVIMAKQLQPPTSKTEKITPTVVGDILENILSPASNTDDETALLDDEMRRIIQEMKYPVEPKSLICTRGVGDQLGGTTVEAALDKVLAEPVKRNTLERKIRLTNLVRNSKQMLAKLVTNDCENEVRMAKSEEIREKLIKVIDLEGDDHFVEPGSSSATGIIRMPPESTLQMVDLESEVHSEGTADTGTETDTDTEKSEKKSSTKTTGDKKNKKKWNLGAKIMKYIRKNGKGKKSNE